MKLKKITRDTQGNQTKTSLKTRIKKMNNKLHYILIIQEKNKHNKIRIKMNRMMVDMNLK